MLYIYLDHKTDTNNQKRNIISTKQDIRSIHEHKYEDLYVSSLWSNCCDLDKIFIETQVFHLHDMGQNQKYNLQGLNFWLSAFLAVYGTKDLRLQQVMKEGIIWLSSEFYKDPLW